MFGPRPIGWPVCALAFVLASPACRRRTEARPFPRSAPSAGWDLAARGLAVATHASPPTQPLRYAVADSCPLGYEFVAHVEQALVAPDDAGSLPSQGIELRGRYDLRARPGGFELVFAETRIRAESEHVRAAGSLLEPAPAWLVSDGASLREVDGPSPAWAALGSFEGAIWFYPTLPSATAIGSSAEWRVRTFAQSDQADDRTLREGRAAGAPAALAADAGTSARAEVRLTDWITVRGAPAATLSSYQDLSASSSSEGIVTQISGNRAGSFVVLARGRLLHATMDTVATMEVRGPTADGALTTRIHVAAEARLVRACDGPVLPAFVDTPSVREEVLELITRLRDAAVAHDRAAILATLSPSLVARYGEQRVVDAITDVVTRHGPLVLGTTELGPLSPLPADARSIRLLGSARDLDGEARMSVSVMATGERIAGRTVFRELDVDSAQNSSEHDVFEFSDRRLFTNAANAPSAANNPNPDDAVARAGIFAGLVEGTSPANGAIRDGGVAGPWRVLPLAPSIAGLLSPDDIRRLVRTNVSTLEPCAPNDALQHATPSPRVAIRVAISGNGSVTSAAAEESDASFRSVATCMSNAIRQWSFPRPEGGDTVSVRLPFLWTR